MQDTGRVRALLNAEARNIVFDATLERAVDEELVHYVAIDRAHCIMLYETGILSRADATSILLGLETLLANNFSDIKSAPTPRGVYLAYENALYSRIGPVAGNVHLARSRNDINATTFCLQLRRPFLQMGREIASLIKALLAIAEQHSTTSLPLATHRQPALPSTIAHHLNAFASAILRDLQAFIALRLLLDRSCLGAGAGAGTTLPINMDRTAALLGFAEASRNSIDSVASRDLGLRLLSVLAMFCSTVSRVAQSLLVWVGDAALMHLPDDLVGSSSAMPHKRNPFLLEHVLGKTAASYGHLMSALGGMHGAPFTNNVSVGGEAAQHVWPSFKTSSESCILLRLCVEGLIPDNSAIARLQEASFITAMELATMAARTGRLDFRAAHAAVGRLVSKATTEGRTDLADMLANSELSWLGAEAAQLTPAAIATAARYGGGPSATAVGPHGVELAQALAKEMLAMDSAESTWREADRTLASAAQRLMGPSR